MQGYFAGEPRCFNSTHAGLYAHGTLPRAGLKTRGWPETLGALRNMVQAATECRAELVPSWQENQAGKEETSPAGPVCTSCK